MKEKDKEGKCGTKFGEETHEEEWEIKFSGMDVDEETGQEVLENQNKFDQNKELEGLS